MSKHVAVVIDGLFGGGSELICLDLVGYLIERSYIVDLVLCEYGGEMVCRVPDGVNLFAVSGSGHRVSAGKQTTVNQSRMRWLFQDGKVGWKQIFYDVLLQWPLWFRNIPSPGYPRVLRSYGLAEYFSIRKPKAVFAFLPWSFYHSVIGSKISYNRVPIIASIHTSINKDINFASYRIFKHFLRRATRVHTVSSGIENTIVSLGFAHREDIKTIANPACRQSNLDSTSLSITHPWVDDKYDGDFKLVIAAGRLEKVKNFSLLITAFAIVAAEHDVKLIIIGDGSQRERLKTQIDKLNLDNCISLPGWEKNVYPFISRCDVFVSSSNSEGCCTVIIEALQAGRNVVATDCPDGGNREILGDGLWGMLVPCNDQIALANAIAESLHITPDREKLALRALDFSTEKLLPLYEQLISDTIDQST